MRPYRLAKTRTRFAIVLACLFMSLVAGGVLAQDPATNTGSSDLDRPIHNFEQQIADWQRQANIEIALVIAVFIFGVVVSALHGSKSPSAKRVTLLLGIGTAALTGITSRAFTADDRTLRRAAFEGNVIVSRLWLMASNLKEGHLIGQDLATAYGEYSKQITEFQAVGERLNGTAKAGPGAVSTTNGFEGLSRVYAQSVAAAPSWVTQPPPDGISLYFVGTNSDVSLSSAKQNSFNNALNNAVQKLRSRAPGATDADILALIKAAAVVQDSASEYDRNAGRYTYYTLLRVSKDIVSLGLNDLSRSSKIQIPQVRFQAKGWQPGDLTSNPTSGLFALSSSGEVSRLVADGQGPSRINKLFQLNRSYSGYAIAANAESVFVATNSALGYTVFKYALKTKEIAMRLVAIKERCTGIAIAGSGFYVTIPDRNEIRHWDTWAPSSPTAWRLSGTASLGYLVFDDIGRRLIVADTSGSAYGVSVSDGAKQLLASNLGAVTSIATSKNHILIASGTKVLFLSRADNRGENPPANLQTLTGGHIVGVAVDTTDGLWFADYDNKVVVGPFPVS